MRLFLSLLLAVSFAFACKKPVSSPNPENPATLELSSEDAKKSKTHSEILSEMFRVVLLDKNPDRSVFTSYLENLNQGASLEGIYNGITRSDFYRKLEISNPGAQSASLRVFGEEIQKIEDALPSVTSFEPVMTEPLPLPQHPSGKAANSVGALPETIVFGEKQDGVAASKTWTPKEYAKFFVGSSFFTLKRIYGDEVLKAIDVKSFDKKVLSDWYGNWAASLSIHGVDFGLELRNKSDANYHSEWAMQAEIENIKWEALNRVHRLLNHFEKKSL